MKTLLGACGFVLLLTSSASQASGIFGHCAIVEKVVFETREDGTERMQIIGAFANSITDEQGALRGFGVESDGAGGFRIPVKRGYMYFTMAADATGRELELLRREWRDLAAQAGTGEAVCFGVYDSYGFYNDNAQIPVDYPRVRDSSEELANPATYRSAGVGLVKLGTGNYDDLVAELSALLDR